MIRRLPVAAMYGVFGGLLVLATMPVWRLWLFGFNPTLDELLSLRCLGL
jgi:hypothetical protein